MNIVSVFAIVGLAAAACTETGGNWYCDAVQALTYENVGFSGAYEAITAMNTDSCTCSTSSDSFSGALAPFNEGLSIHMRGPLHLEKLAVYMPGANGLTRRRKRAAENCKRDVVTQVDVETTYVTVTVPAWAESESSSSTTTTTSSSSSSTTLTSSSVSATATGWVLDSYYDASAGTQDNIVFMNHLGGTNGSGTWSSCFGNSISYATSDGLEGAGSSQVLDSTTLPSNTEIIAFTGEACDSSCGWYPSDIPAFKGFQGDNKVFAFEFTMPTATDSATENYDMPAIWLLNAQIPRTQQYGTSACSCWSTGCGEFDLFEVLSSGSDSLVSHVHDSQGSSTETAQGGGGSADYFSRPLTSTMTAIVVFSASNNSVSIVQVDEFDFSASYSVDEITAIASVSGSTFTLP